MRALTALDALHPVRAGVGVGTLPRQLGDRAAELRRLLDVPRETWSGVSLLTHPELRTAARVRAVKAHLGDAFL